jgi:hypothetical protein
MIVWLIIEIFTSLKQAHSSDKGLTDTLLLYVGLYHELKI